MFGKKLRTSASGDYMGNIILETVFGREDIYVEREDGQAIAEGFVVNSDRSPVSNWLEYRNGIFESAAPEAISSHQRVAFVNAMEVDWDIRCEGHGNALLEEFIRQARLAGAQAVFTHVDTSEEQTDGFTVEGWLSEWGFEKVCDTDNGALMSMPLNETL
jgi:N-acetylglutamate synthase-like GNAT family acetyltransferase